MSLMADPMELWKMLLSLEQLERQKEPAVNLLEPCEHLLEPNEMKLKLFEKRVEPLEGRLELLERRIESFLQMCASCEWTQESLTVSLGTVLGILSSFQVQ